MPEAVRQKLLYTRECGVDSRMIYIALYTVPIRQNERRFFHVLKFTSPSIRNPLPTAMEMGKNKLKETQKTIYTHTHTHTHTHTLSLFTHTDESFCALYNVEQM